MGRKGIPFGLLPLAAVLIILILAIILVSILVIVLIVILIVLVAILIVLISVLFVIHNKSSVFCLLADNRNGSLPNESDFILRIE